MLKLNTSLPQSTGNNQFNFIHKTAKLVNNLLNYVVGQVKVGGWPLVLKSKAILWGRMHNLILNNHNINLCRFGYIHPPASDNTPFMAGETFTIDIWLQVGGHYFDMAYPCFIEPVPPLLRQLKQVALTCHKATQQAAVYGAKLYSIANAAQNSVRNSPFHIIEEACGHGIGSQLHQLPDIAFSYNAHGLFSKLNEGIITLEPAISLLPQQIIIDNNLAYLNKRAPFLFVETMHLISKNGSHTLT
jgi:hypothetical protein